MARLARPGRTDMPAAPLVSNARMYSVTPGVGQMWRALFEAIGHSSGVALTWVEHAAPRPLAELWRQADLGAVFMCGLPFSRAEPRPVLVVAPVPSPAAFGGLPRYWSELVVRADGPFQTVADTFGKRIALTTPDSQSGCLAALYYLQVVAEGGGTAGTRPGMPLYDEVIAPRITPRGAMMAVIDGEADIAPIDSFAFSLLQRYSPELTSQLRVVGQTEPTAIPPIIASQPVPRSLETAFLEAHKNSATGSRMADLQLERFVRADPAAYDELRRRYDGTVRYWGEHAFAARVPPTFARVLSASQNTGRDS